MVMPDQWYPASNLLQFFRCGIHPKSALQIHADYLPAFSLISKMKRIYQLSLHLIFKKHNYDRLARKGYLEYILQKLSKKGWLDNHNRTYRLSGKSRQIMQQKLKVKPQDVILLVHYFRNLIYANNPIDGYNGIFGLYYAEHILNTLEGRHLLLASLANVIGKTYVALGNYDKAVYYQMIEVNHCEALLTQDDMNLAYPYGVAAIYCYYNEEFVNAKELIEKSACIFQKNVGEEDENYKNLLHWRDDIYEAYEAHKSSY